MVTKELVSIIKSYMQQVPQVHILCRRCLETQRWQGNILSMIADAAFTSTGLNYFLTVVPAVLLFNQIFLETGRLPTTEQLCHIPEAELQTVWKNRRSWQVAQNICAYLTSRRQAGCEDDREALRSWATDSSLAEWKNDPIGSINGVGINTFQYLRMMGGIDTVMPDKIVKKILGKIHNEAGIDIPYTDMEFITYVEQLAPRTGYRAIEFCWMTWLVQSEAALMETNKYTSILENI